MNEFQEKLLELMQTMCDEFSEINLHLQGIEDAMYDYDDDDDDDGEEIEDGEEEDEEEEEKIEPLRLCGT